MLVETKIVSVILHHEDETLLLNRKCDFKDYNFGKGLWELPGGKSDLNELETETAIREVYEETAIEIKIKKESKPQLFITENIKSNEKLICRHYTIFFYPLKDKMIPRLSEEHANWKYCNKKEIAKLIMLPKLKEYLIQRLCYD